MSVGKRLKKVESTIRLQDAPPELGFYDDQDKEGVLRRLRMRYGKDYEPRVFMRLRPIMVDGKVKEYNIGDPVDTKTIRKKDKDFDKYMQAIIDSVAGIETELI